MEIRYAVHPDHMRSFDTDKLRRHFLVERLFQPDKMNLVYSHVDRIIIGGVCPVRQRLSLPASRELGVDYFLERRELGVINIGAAGKVLVEKKGFSLSNKQCLYIGSGARKVSFASADPRYPAKFYFLSAPAHTTYDTVKITLDDAPQVHLGSPETANVRTIYQLIHPSVLKSCQLVMGFTALKSGSTWNTMPPHSHDRRMEVYLYLDLPADALVFHFMGLPEETRHLVVRNEEAVIAPSWSIHAGTGTKNYTFIWGMAGENQTFTDMDDVPFETIK